MNIRDSLPDNVLGKLLVIRDNAPEAPIHIEEPQPQQKLQMAFERGGEEMATTKLSTVVLVDFENWYWGLNNIWKGAKPDVQTFFNMVQSRGDIKQVKFFGDFTKLGIKEERMKLRAISNNIIDCATEGGLKDYTDFIMLDHIYQTYIENPEIEQYVFFTGDGHFHSAVSYLRRMKGKTVGVYSIKGTMNHNLKMSANWWEEIAPLTTPKASEPAKSTVAPIVQVPKVMPAPASKPQVKVEPPGPKVEEKKMDPRDIEQMIVEQIFKMSEQGKYPSYMRTVEHLVHILKVRYEDIAAVASQMLADGIIRRMPKEYCRQGVPTKAYILEINWEKWAERLIEREEKSISV